MKLRIAVIFALYSLASCGGDQATEQEGVAAANGLDALAQVYLYLELSMARHDNAHVDAYFGPEDIRESANEEQLSLEEIENRTVLLTKQLLDTKAATKTIK